MDEKGIEKYQPKNPTTQAAHRREVFWQITFPLLIGAVIILAAVVLVIVMAWGGTLDGAETNKLANVSLIWLIVPAMGISLVVAAVLAGLVYVVSKLIQVLPVYTFKVDQVLLALQMRIRQYSDIAAKPVMSTKSGWASIRAIFGKRP